MDSLLTAEVRTMTLNTKKPEMLHPNAGLRWFAAISFGSGEIIRLYCVTLVYSSQVSERQERKEHGEGIMSVIVQTLTKWKVRIPDKVRDENRTYQSALIVRAPFCVTRYVNDAMYCVEGETTTEDNTFGPYEYNVAFEPKF